MNLREGVLKPDIYDPTLNPLYRDVLRHYGAVALPCRVADPDRKGKVESAIGHTQAALKGLRYVHNNKDDTVAIISTYYKIEKDLARAAYDTVIDTFPKQGLPAKGAVENTIRRMGLFQKMARPKEPFKAEDAVDFRILNRLLKEGTSQ